MKRCRRNSRQSGSVFDLAGTRKKIEELEIEMQSPDFWKDTERASKLSRELNELKEEAGFWNNFEKETESLSGESDVKLETKSREIKELERNFNKQHLKTFLSGKYDKGNALLYIYSGAGGVDAQDWASMLLNMYRKYCEIKGLGFSLLHQAFGEPRKGTGSPRGKQGGTKNAVAEITGRYAFGNLRGESGVHRLVRISPFSAKALRHTSFALVDILPEIEDAKLEINPKDLRVDTFRSSGPGGQNVNKLETAVRITHIPTNMVVAVQSERSQAQNKEKAMQILKSRLAKMLEDAKVKELSELKTTGETAIEWGSQIRSYVLNPYKQVKDHRTGIESSQPDHILNGELDEFIEAEILRAGK